MAYSGETKTDSEILDGIEDKLVGWTDRQNYSAETHSFLQELLDDIQFHRDHN